MTWPPRAVRIAVPPLVATCLVAALFGCSSDTDEPPSSDPSPSPTVTSPVPTPEPEPDPDPDPEAASSQDLIATALDSGAIDLGTSLELRAWALFGDARLPEAYDGTGSSGHDPRLLREIEAALATLPPESRAELGRYLLRPTDARSPFSSTPVDNARVAADDGKTRCTAPRQWFQLEWSPDGTADRGFRVHACGASKATVREDLDATVAIGKRLWPTMTASGANGMGPPVPDTRAAPNHEGNGKVDVYLVDALAQCRDRGSDCAAIETGVALASPVTAACVEPGFPVAGCSGYMVLGRDRLAEPAFAADFAHEFFHVLQFAHNAAVDSWYIEASAVWAEFHYERESSEEDSFAHFQGFQENGRSLLVEDPERDFEYESWGWPLYQSTTSGAQSVFAAWRGIESASTRAEADAAVDRALPFKTGFREFAVLNAQPAAYIPPASSGLDRWQDRAGLSDFPTDSHRVTGRRSPVNLGRSSHAADVDALQAQYDEYEVLDKDVREVVVDITKLTGAGHADLDVLARVGGGDTWKRFPAYGGKVTLCRDLPAEDVSFFQVVVSNHVVARDGRLPDAGKRVHGSYTIEAKDECEPREKYLVGSLSWRATDQNEFRTTKVSGQMELVLHQYAPGSYTAEREDSSTYAYDVALSDCRPDTSLSGTVETGIQGFEPEWHIANVLASQTDLTATAELQIYVELFDEWEVTCTDQSGTTYPFTVTGAGLFPGCARFGTVLGTSNKAGGFTISCDVAVPGSTWTGHISGELHPMERPADDG